MDSHGTIGRYLGCQVGLNISFEIQVPLFLLTIREKVLAFVLIEVEIGSPIFNIHIAKVLWKVISLLFLQNGKTYLLDLLLICGRMSL